MKNIFSVIIRKKAPIYITLMVFILVAAALSVVCSQIMVYIVDNLTHGVVFIEMIIMLLIYFAATITQNIVAYFQTILITHLNEQVCIEVKGKIVSSLYEKPLNYFSEQKSGDLQQVLFADVLNVTSFYTETVLSIISNAFTAVAIIAYLAYLQWDLLLIVLLLQPVIIIVQSFWSKKVYTTSSGYRDAVGDAASFSQEIIVNIIQYIALGIKAFCLLKFQDYQQKSAHESIKCTSITKLSDVSFSCITSIIFILIFGFGGYKVSVGAMTVGMLIAFVQFSQNLLDPFLDIFNIKIEYERIRPSMDRIDDIINFQSVQYGNVRSGIKGNVELCNLSFSYSESTPILNNISAEFEKGKTYCIIGKSGAGKTTLCNLILRLCQPSEGQIRIDGIPINSFNEEYFHNNITYIAQIPFIFNGSIKENISLDRTVSNEMINEAALFAGLSEDMQKFSDNLEQSTGDSGGKLSVGQRQRIGLARAYIRNTPIVIFDEPTASIGQDYTKWFISQLDDYKKDRLIIIISHDKEVADSCDVVFKLNSQGHLEK